jgi:hypothetical protein
MPVQLLRSRTFTRSQMGGSVHSSIVRAPDGATYYAGMVNSGGQKILIGKVAPGGGSYEEILITPNVTHIDSHHGISIGISADGILHLLGPLHQDDLEYWKSNSPNSIGSSVADWTKQPITGSGTTGSFCNGIECGIADYDSTYMAHTYNAFHYGPNGDLFMTGRMRVANNGSATNGVQGGMLHKYNTGTQSWEQMGGNTNPLYVNNVPQKPGGVATPTWVWWSDGNNPLGCLPTGQANSFYVNPSTHPHLDINGRWHWAIRVFREVEGTAHGGYASAVAYIYSDDLGETWRLADGTLLVDKPIVLPGNNDKDVVYCLGPQSTHWYQYQSCAMDYGTGYPIVIAGTNKNGYEQRMSKWNGSSWVETVLPWKGYSARIMQDDKGVIYAASGNTIYRSVNYGNTWQSEALPYAGAGSVMQEDRYGMQQTNKVIAWAMPNGSGELTASLYEYESPVWTPVSGNPNPPPPDPDPPPPDPDPDPSIPQLRIQFTAGDPDAEHVIEWEPNDAGFWFPLVTLAPGVEEYVFEDISPAAKIDIRIRSKKNGLYGDTPLTGSQAATFNLAIGTPLSDLTVDENVGHQYTVGGPYKTPLNFTVASGTLPSGTTLDASTGLLSGQVDTEETAAYTIRVTDGWGTTADIVESVEVAAAAGGSTALHEWTFDEGTGTEAANSGTEADVATLQANASWAGEGKFGGEALSVTSGVNGCATVPDDSTFHFLDTDAWTASCFVKVSSLPSAWQSILWCGAGGAGSRWGIMISPTNTINMNNGDNFFNFSSGITLTTGDWVHILIKQDPTEATEKQQIWVNGVKGNTQNSTKTANGAGNLHIGSRDLTATESFAGLIDHVQIWDRALTPAEIANVYSTGSDGGAVTPAEPDPIDVRLAWTDNSDDETSFRIEQNIDGAGWQTIATVAANVEGYIVEGVDNNKVNQFRVFAVNSRGDSAASNTASIGGP